MEFLQPPTRSEMKCYSCMYGNPLTTYTIECRNNPQYINKEASDWCGCGLWRIWSDRLKCWTHYYYHEGLDDTTTE